MDEGKEIIKSLIGLIEGTEENYGLIRMLDGYYNDCLEDIGCYKILKEAKLFIGENIK